MHVDILKQIRCHLGVTAVCIFICSGGGRGGGGGGFGGPPMPFGPPREDLILGTSGRPGGSVRVMSVEDTERAIQDTYDALDPKFKVSSIARKHAW